MEEPRFSLASSAPEAVPLLLELGSLASAKLDSRLLELVKLRASQINGCAFCLEMHADQALRSGEKPERLVALDACQESPLFSRKEQAALAYVEAITRLPSDRVSAAIYDPLADHFEQDEIAWLTVACALINAWNRIQVASRARYEQKAPVSAKG